MCLSIALKRPDLVLETGEHLGYEYAVTHNGKGYRCGYVRVPAGHPFYGLNRHALDVEIHGSVTFAEADVPCEKEGDDTSWWIGFDCAHALDAPDPELLAPQLSDGIPPCPLWYGEEVRSADYVRSECYSLCRQAAAA